MYDRPALALEVDKRWSVSTNEGTCKRQNHEALLKPYVILGRSVYSIYTVTALFVLCYCVLVSVISSDFSITLPVEIGFLLFLFVSSLLVNVK